MGGGGGGGGGRGACPQTSLSYSRLRRSKLACLTFTSRKQGKESFGGEIITGYNTKAVNVDAYQRSHNNSDTAGKGYKGNLTLTDTLLCLILTVVEKASYIVICDGQFSFSQRTSQVKPSPLLLDTFPKSSTLPWQNRQHTASWSFPTLAKKFVNLDSAGSFNGFFFRSFSHLLAIFLVCSRNPCRSLLISKLTLAKRFCRLLSSSSRGRKRTKALFSS